ncbi:class I SAM-dependent methyltransferase [Streptomyces sp. NPDC093801]|uniref:class I SAM-dependent methyltransferase n=1 Tax=Streptomyces sp. NPDC093801 TaxID=3155203 RepID=UPI00344E89F6
MGDTIDVSVWNDFYDAGRWFRPVMDEEREALRRMVGHGPGRMALDVGCGTGGFAKFLAEEGYSVLGVDYSAKAVELAQSSNAETLGLQFMCLDAEGDDWEDLPAYDLISTRLTYAFIGQKSDFLKKVRGRLTPGGVFQVMTPLAEKLPESRRSIGITADELEEMCQGWSSVEETVLDAQHTIYTLTV